MKMRSALLLLPVVFLGCATDEPREPEVEVVSDIVGAAPDRASMVFENDFVRATRIRLAPGEELPEHSGDARAVYSLSDYRILWTEAGESTEREWRAGQAHWHDAIEHAVQNIGQTEARFLVVARTDAALPDAGGLLPDQDAAGTVGAYGELIFENEHVRVVEVTLPPGAAQPTHHGLSRLVYSLSDYTIRYESDRLDAAERTFAPGDAHWHDPDEHTTENVGESEARFVIFQFKE